MSLLDAKTGALSLDGRISLKKGTSGADLREAIKKSLPAVSYKALRKSRALPLPAAQVPGGSLAPMCFLENDRLCAVRLHALGRDGRALLIALLPEESPVPEDDGSAVEISYPFGAALLSRCPRTGRWSVLIRYR